MTISAVLEDDGLLEKLGGFLRGLEWRDGVEGWVDEEHGMPCCD